MPRIFSGIQPSGELHIGNYLGAVKNWVALQHEFESFFCVVNYRAITIPFAPEELAARPHAMALGPFAAGLDAERATVFVQSQIPEHTELAWIFNTVTPLGELERQTQFKEKAARQEQVMAGLLNYPVLQAADILLYRAELVPVGEDQIQHLELSRVVARNWNARFSPPTPYRPPPTRTPGGPPRAASRGSTARPRCRSRSAIRSACWRNRTTSGRSCARRSPIPRASSGPIPASPPSARRSTSCTSRCRPRRRSRRSRPTAGARSGAASTASACCTRTS